MLDVDDAELGVGRQVAPCPHRLENISKHGGVPFGGPMTVVEGWASQPSTTSRASATG